MTNFKDFKKLTMYSEDIIILYSNNSAPYSILGNTIYENFRIDYIPSIISLGQKQQHEHKSTTRQSGLGFGL